MTKSAPLFPISNPRFDFENSLSFTPSKPMPEGLLNQEEHLDIKEALKDANSMRPVTPMNTKLSTSIMSASLATSSISDILDGRGMPLQMQTFSAFDVYKRGYWVRLEKVLEEKECQKLLRRSKLRARYIGYLYQVLAYSDVSYAVRPLVQQKLKMPSLSSWTLDRLPWLVTYSGSATVDTEANLFANWAMEKENKGRSVEIVHEIHEGLADILRASLLSTLRVPCILPVEPEQLEEEEVCKYLLLFSTPKQSPEELHSVTEDDKKVPALVKEDLERIYRDRTMFAVQGVGTCFKKPNWPVCQTEASGIGATPAFTGIRITEILGTERIRRSTSADPARDMILDATNDAMMIALRAQSEGFAMAERQAFRDGVKSLRLSIDSMSAQNSRRSQELGTRDAVPAPEYRHLRPGYAYSSYQRCGGG